VTADVLVVLPAEGKSVVIVLDLGVEVVVRCVEVETVVRSLVVVEVLVVEEEDDEAITLTFIVSESSLYSRRLPVTVMVAVPAPFPEIVTTPPE
jgi:hypothetical protein